MAFDRDGALPSGSTLCGGVSAPPAELPLDEFARLLPKTETHLHFEGALPIELLRSVQPDVDLSSLKIRQPGCPGTTRRVWPSSLSSTLSSRAAPYFSHAAPLRAPAEHTRQRERRSCVRAMALLIAHASEGSLCACALRCPHTMASEHVLPRRSLGSRAHPSCAPAAGVRAQGLLLGTPGTLALRLAESCPRRRQARLLPGSR